MKHTFLTALALFVWVSWVDAFTVSLLPQLLTCRCHCQHRGSFALSSTANTDEAGQTATTSKGLFKRERYVATNRFAVRKGQQAKFEKRWATRKSSLATLDGFQYFHLMRRVTLSDDGTSATFQGGETSEEAFENYVSFTIWNKKSHFSAWRSGEAFKEAHGGTSIGAFVSTLVRSAMVLRGAPRPAFYDGLFLQSTVPEHVPETHDGWRTVEADGVNMLNPECFVAFTKFYILAQDAPEFEAYWSQHQPNMNDVKGFVASTLMRRDGTAKGHGIVELKDTEPTYVQVRVFQDLASYQAWAADGGGGDADATTNATTWPTSFLAKRAPETVFYEGTLVISSPKGA